MRLARFTLEDHANGASRLPKTSENNQKRKVALPMGEIFYYLSTGNVDT